MLFSIQKPFGFLLDQPFIVHTFSDFRLVMRVQVKKIVMKAKNKVKTIKSRVKRKSMAWLI